MARQFLTGLNLNKNELLNARIQNLANDPSNPVLGQIYFNTSLNEMRVYNGTEFEAVGLNGVTASAAEINILDGATLSTEELNYVDGVTSGIQGQLNEKAPLNNPVFTGTVSLVSDLIFEGSSADGNELTVTAANPTADHTITLPDASGTVILSSDTVNALTAPAANFSMNNHKITGLAEPTQAQDAATKAYVDGVAEGLHIHESAYVATLTNIADLSDGPGIVDGVTLDDTVGVFTRVLVRAQTNHVQNGIYVATKLSGGNWSYTRALDFDSPAEVDSGDFVFVTNGDTLASTGWVQTNVVGTIGSDPVEFTQFSGAGTYLAGDGLSLNGTTFNVGGTSNRITVSADSVDIASTYVGQTSITTLGTIATGTWEATDVAVAHGGTGASDAAGAKTNLGFMTRFAASNDLLVPSSGIVTWTVTHSLGTKDVTVQVYDLATDATVEVDVVRTSTSVVTLSWVAGANVAADSYRVVVVG
jgi:hypothetical protein